MLRRLAAALVAVALSAPQAAHAWTRQGHMVTAAIAYDALMARDPKLVDELLELLSHHPDPASFDVAEGRAEGEARARRLIVEMARWPDDARESQYDHPTWHYAFQPVTDPKSPPPIAPPQGLEGDALEAFALNVRVAANRKAPAADRAVALCWVMHVAGDIHQPLHAAQQVSARFPYGDGGGGRQFVIDPLTGDPISLHWFWDDAINRLDSPDAVTARARQIEARLPRSAFPELKTPATPGQFPAWRAESYALAAPAVYAETAGTSEAEAAPLSKAYVDRANALTERRAALAGYRLADILAWILTQP